MTSYEEILSAILAVPADDRPRLLMADFLDERGDEEMGDALHAEFIRIQCSRISEFATPI